MSLVAISGASRGIGLALAREFAARGHDVVVGARSLGIDVTDAAAVRAWAAATGAPDVVIACAGVVNAPAPIWELDSAEWDAALAVNVGGVANMARAFLPAMIARGSGTFIAISSGWGRRGKEGLSPYCASKFAVEGLVQSVALELPAPLSIVSLDPGTGVRTPMLETCLPDEYDQYPSPELWAETAIEYVLDVALQAPNGSALTVPLVEAVA
jgi:NAD(P)-dependent dehydrogenase (short-subunit alcohol dehydrogenase family)